VWTPKRVLILFGGFVLFGALFVVYSFVLGSYDGLPILPEKYLPSPDREPPVTPPPGTTEKKILLAWGAECEEMKRETILDLSSKGLLISAGKFEIDNGRVKLTPFSAALFPKGRRDDKHPEINTVKCELAYLTFDKPIKSVTEMNSRKIIGVELRGAGGVTIINNRRTPQDKTDDIEILITNAPLFYDDQQGLLWSEGYVRMTDFQTQPEETKITAKGMELHMAREGSPGKAKAKGKGENVNGVESLKLHSDVNMSLWMDARSGFMGDAQPAEKKPAPPTPGEVAEKAHVVIQTNGPFHYDLTEEKAHFQSPKQDAVGSPWEYVLVTREHKVGPGKAHDQLKCDDLYLQFRRKPPSSTPPPSNAGSTDGGAGDKEIESALATVNPGRSVRLDMATEKLTADGSEMSYLSATATSGPETVLKGSPLNAAKDGHLIEAPELHLIGADKKGLGQKAFARGAGHIDLYDAKTKKYSQHAIWSESMSSTKVPDSGKKDKVLDLLTLVGDAMFKDDEHMQELKGQKIQVWLEPAGKSNEPAKAESNPSSTGTPTSQQKPQRLEAWGKVQAFGPEMVIKWTNHLVLHFKEASEARPGQLPEMTSDAKTPPPGPGKTGEPASANPNTAKKDADPKKAEEKPRRPFEIEANEIVAYILRTGSQNQLQELVTEGNVHVIQAGETPKDKGVDITGEMLNLLHYLQGDILYVFGDAKKPGRLQMGEIVLVGPKVTINQKDNIAEVDGLGYMQLPGNSNMDGSKSAKPGTVLTIHWTKDMVFNGKYADFHGGVVAYQDNGRIKCRNMQVTLDKEVSFKEGQKDKQSAKVEKLLCELNVFVEDEVKDVNGKLVSTSYGEFTQLTVDNLVGLTIGTGTGYVARFGKDSNDPLASAEPTPVALKPAGNTKEVDKYTLVKFKGRLFSVVKDKTRNSKFYEDVEVFNQPADGPHPAINPNVVPKDGFQLKCSLLSIYTRPVAGKSCQYMEAERPRDVPGPPVSFRTEEFHGTADIVKFDEADDIVIFEARPGNTVAITKFKGGAAAAQGQQLRGKKILYNRKTGAFRIDGSPYIEGRLRDEPTTPFSRSPLASAAGRGPRRAALAKGERLNVSLPLTWLHANGEDETFLALGLIARDDRQKLAAHGAILDLALVGRRHGDADAVLRIGPMLDDHHG